MNFSNIFFKQGIPFGLMAYVISQLVTNIFNGFLLMPLFGAFFIDLAFIMALALLYSFYVSFTK